MPRPATPAATKGERTRARVIAAAIDHFAATGLDAGSVPEIARQVGVSHSALYQHFGRKEALFRAAVDSDLSALFERARLELLAGPHTPESIVALVPVLAAESRRHPLARRVLANMEPEQAEALRDLPALATLELDLLDAVAAGQREGAIRADLPAAELSAGLITLALALLVLALRLDGMRDIPRGASALSFLSQTLRPSH